MSEQRCLRELLSDEELGDRKPSQLLRRMRQLLGQRKFDDMHSHSSAPTLPVAATGSSASILAVSKDSVSLEDMAELADRIDFCCLIFTLSNYYFMGTAYAFL